jgi:hypothetical protein
VTRKIEHMHADVDEREPALGGEIRLGLVDVEAVPEGEACKVRRPTDTVAQFLGDLEHWPLPAEILVDHQRNAKACSGLDHRFRIANVEGEWLLADHRDAGRRRPAPRAGDGFSTVVTISMKSSRSRSSIAAASL